MQKEAEAEVAQGTSVEAPTERRVAPRGPILLRALFEMEGTLLPSVCLERVRLLSMSKVDMVTVRGKGPSKGKGKVKSPGRGKDKSKGSSAQQEFQALYFGDDGYVICVQVHGDDVRQAPSIDRVNSLVNIDGLKPRAGVFGTLYWTSQTSISFCLEARDVDGQSSFPYDVSQVTQDFATYAYVQEMKAGDSVALVVQVLRAEEKHTNNSGEPYLEVFGIDMNKSSVGPLRLWMHQEGDLVEGHTYILCGLKAAYETYWDDSSGKYIPNMNGRMLVECT